MLFKVAGFADAQRRRQATTAAGALTWMSQLVGVAILITRSSVTGRCQSVGHDTDVSGLLLRVQALQRKQTRWAHCTRWWGSLGR